MKKIVEDEDIEELEFDKVKEEAITITL